MYRFTPVKRSPVSGLHVGVRITHAGQDALSASISSVLMVEIQEMQATMHEMRPVGFEETCCSSASAPPPARR